MNNNDRINYRLRAPTEKRRLVGPAVQHEPWYSINRPRNIVFLAAIMASLAFVKPIMDAFHSTKAGVRLYKLQEKYKKELDIEEMEDLNKQTPPMPAEK